MSADSPVTPGTPGAGPRRGPREVLDLFHRAMLALSADDLAELYAVDGVHEFPFLFPGMPPRYEGREEIRAGYAAVWGASPARPRRIEEIAVHQGADSEVIVAEHVVTGTLASDGLPFAFPGLLVLRIRDGLIVHARDYMDGLAVAHRMGRLEAVAARFSEPGDGSGDGSGSGDDRS
ncbi:nuclear transport factor 2 family protein [Streptomyces sp. NPDC048172]|uniref:nuclear transport factor 2 family protein n=1 Tax=Streptomyces sp. NPDC048172 TaxID=3365505 RepID=UPI003711D759